MTMDNVTFFEVESFGETIEHALIAHADGSFTSMLKSTYDALEAAKVEHLTEIIPSE
jgi:hypothetical protein